MKEEEEFLKEARKRTYCKYCGFALIDGKCDIAQHNKPKKQKSK